METQLNSQHGPPPPPKESITPSVETTMTTDHHMEDVTPTALRSSPPPMPEKPSMVRSAVDTFPDDRAAKSDSEAETIVLPGKNGYSPSKTRKTIKHEDQSEEGEICEDAESREALAELKPHTVPSSSNVTSTTLGKRKRPKHGKSKDDQTFVGNSSGLSSVPTSPAVKRTKPLKNNSRHSRSSSPHTAHHKASSVDGGVPAREDVSSGEEGETRKQNQRQRSVGGTRTEGSVLHKQDNHRTTKSQPNSGEKSRKHTRSESPPPRSHHRRVSSAQTTSGAINGLSHKKKRVPAPLLATRDRAATEYHSDDSSASGSPHPRSSRLRKLATPATGESLSASAPIGKMAKNRRDAVGRTLLARACANNDLAAAKEILDASHDDLNLPDYAGNTPLQISCLGGHADIVKLLIDHGCDLTCVNGEKDTPLLDAVENCHLDVVKLLIDAGVDPRRGNVKGEEPVQRLPEHGENRAEIEKVLKAAKAKFAPIRRPSEDLSNHDNDDRSSRGTSPRPSPSMQNPDGPRRRANGRSTKTRNDFLYQPMDVKTLRGAAGRGDTETVNRILQVRDNIDDPESLVLACRGGHEDVIQLLLAIGGAKADPPPLSSNPSIQPEFATPMLAAIGRDKIEVVKLLLDQPNFDPTGKFEGQTYFEIAKRRQGSRWKEEEAILKEAFNKHAAGIKASSSRPRSPELRRDSERSGKRTGDKIESTSPQRKIKLSSPETSHNDIRARVGGANISTKLGSPSADNHHKTSLQKPTKNKKDEHRQSNLSTEQDSTMRPKPAKKRSESETAHPSSDNDPVKPRRKLMSGKELKDEKEKQRRESIASVASATSASKDRVEVKGGGAIALSQDPDSNMDRIPDRPRPLKRDDSKDRLGAIRGDSPAKKPRESSTPPRAGSFDSSRNAEDVGLPVKKRRLDAQGLASSSPENRTNSSLLSSESGRSKGGVPVKERHPKSSSSQAHGPSSDGHPEAKKTAVQNKRPTPTTSNSQDKVRQVEKASSSGPSSHGQREPGSKDVKPKEQKLAQKSEQKIAEDREAKIKKERAEQEDRKRKEAEGLEEERKGAEAEKLEAERRRLEAEKLEAERKRLQAEKAEAERKRLEAEKAEAEERARREEEMRIEEEKLEQKRVDERKAAEKRAREVEVQQARELEARVKEEAKRRQEEADLRERQEAEAKEEKKRIFLEQEQKRKNEEMERKRAAHAAREAEARAERARLEAERRAKLPPLLRVFETYHNPQTPEFASLFKDMLGFRYDTIVPDATGPEAKELWILNTQVAFLLGFKDLQLSRYTAWDRVSAPRSANTIICRMEGDRYACTDPSLRIISPKEPTEYSGTELRNKTLPLIMNLELFFVKLSEFLYIVPHFPHLRNIKMSVRYQELPKEDGSFWNKWKQEPGAGPFAPRWTYYMNGQLVGEDGTRYAVGRSTPFPRGLASAPRDPDNMIGKLTPDSPRYLDACRAQGLYHLLPGEEGDAALSRRNGRRSSGGNGNVTMNGFTPSPSAPSETGRFNQHAGLDESSSDSPRPGNGPNGDVRH